MLTRNGIARCWMETGVPGVDSGFLLGTQQCKSAFENASFRRRCTTD